MSTTCLCLPEKDLIDFVLAPFDMKEETLEKLKEMNMDSVPVMTTGSADDQLQTNEFALICGENTFDQTSIKSIERMLPAMLSPPLRTPLRSICPEQRRKTAALHNKLWE